MRVRLDSVFISSLLLTVVLLYLIAPSLWSFSLNHILLAPMDNVHSRGEAQSVASLAVILIGLIVVWTGYAKRSRPAWFVMFVIVWLWAFPRFILSVIPLVIRERPYFTLPELLCDAFLGPGFARDLVELYLAFFLMVIGLALPMRRVFVARKEDEPVRVPSLRFFGFSVIGAMIVVVVLFFWVRFGILYEIPVAQVNASLLAPPPPPPPTPTRCKCIDGNTRGVDATSHSTD